MTIAAALLTHEGLVLGSDSATTVFGVGDDGEPRVIGSVTGTQKLFQLGLTRSCGVLLVGQGAFGSRSYRDLLTEFDLQLGEATPPLASELPHMLFEFVQERWKAEAKKIGTDPKILPDTNLIVGGSGDGETQCSFARVRLNAQGGQRSIDVFTEPGRFTLDGCPSAAHRLIYGVDDNTLRLLVDSGVLSEEQAVRAVDVVMGPNRFRAAPYPWLPLRDGLDYVHFLIFASIKYYKFIGGPPPCGGKVELASVTTDRGFRWVTHKSLDWCISDCGGQTEYSPLDPHGHGR